MAERVCRGGPGGHRAGDRGAAAGAGGGAGHRDHAGRRRDAGRVTAAPGAVAAMIQYCYQLDYGGDCASVNTALYQIVTLRPHVDTFVLAERYGIPGLKKLALQKFESLATAMVKVDGNGDDFLRTMRYLYDPPRRNKADVLRRVALKLCADHLGTAVLGIGKTVSGTVTLMEEIPEFRSDLFEILATRWK